MNAAGAAMAASAAAGKMSAGMDAPPGDVYGEDGQQGGGEGGQEGGSTKATCREILTRWGAAITFAVDALAIALTSMGTGKYKTWGKLETGGKIGRACTYGSCGTGAVNSPVTVNRARKLTKANTLRDALNLLREDANRLTLENDKLSAEIDELEDQVDRLKDIETALTDLTSTQGEQLDTLMSLVGENKQIVKEMRDVLRSRALEEVISAVIESDTDGDFRVEGDEIEGLVMRMRVIDEVNFDEEKFRSVVNKRGSVADIIDIVGGMFGGEDGEENEGCTAVMESSMWLEQERSRRSQRGFY